jgi:hypothetical protein
MSPPSNPGPKMAIIFQKNYFCVLAKVQFIPNFFQGIAVFEKGHDQKMFLPLSLASACFSDARTTFGIGGIV